MAPLKLWPAHLTGLAGDLLLSRAYQTVMKAIYRSHPAWSPRSEQLPLTEAESQYLHTVASRNGMSFSAFVRASLGLPQTVADARRLTLEDRLDLLNQAEVLLRAAGIESALGDVATLRQEAADEIQRRDTPRRPAGRPSAKLTEARKAWYEENARKNAFFASIGSTLPPLPTTLEQEQAYRLRQR